MTRLPTISAVAATYGRRDRLEAFLGRLVADRSLHEIVIAVDGSPDGSLAFLEEQQYRDSRVRPLWVEHRGQFGALDVAIRAASGEVVLLLDDDVLLEPGAAEGHAHHHARGPDRVVLGYMPVRLPARPTAADFATLLYHLEYEGRCRRHEADQASVLSHLWGGHLSMPRRAYLDLDYQPLEAPEAAGPLRLYHQDRDLGLHCRAAGLEGYFDRRLTSLHLHQRDPGGFLRDAFGQGACEVLISQRGPAVAPTVVTGPSRPQFGLATLLEHVPRRSVETPGSLQRLLDASIRTGSVRSTLVVARALRRLQQLRGVAHIEQILVDGG